MVPPRIDQEYLDRGNDLVLNLFQYVSNFLRPPQWRPINVIEERRIFSQLPVGLRSLYLICRLQLDISSDGGFDALLKNGYFLMTHEIMESFKLIQAIKHGDVFLKFTSAYEDRLEEMGRGLFEKHFHDTFITDLENLTSEYCKADDSEDLRQLQLDHIRANPQLYYHRP